MNSVRERSILAVRIAKYGPLREPIRMLLFTLDQFSHIITDVITGLEAISMGRQIRLEITVFVWKSEVK